MLNVAIIESYCYGIVFGLLYYSISLIVFMYLNAAAHWVLLLFILYYPIWLIELYCISHISMLLLIEIPTHLYCITQFGLLSYTVFPISQCWFSLSLIVICIVLPNLDIELYCIYVSQCWFSLSLIVIYIVLPNLDIELYCIYYISMLLLIEMPNIGSYCISNLYYCYCSMWQSLSLIVMELYLAYCITRLVLLYLCISMLLLIESYCYLYCITQFGLLSYTVFTISQCWFSLSLIVIILYYPIWILSYTVFTIYLKLAYLRFPIWPTLSYWVLSSILYIESSFYIVYSIWLIELYCIYVSQCCFSLGYSIWPTYIILIFSSI